MGFFASGRNYDLVLIELLNHIKIIAIAVLLRLELKYPLG
jgi:osmoprotectant transport system permease protein